MKFFIALLLTALLSFAAGLYLPWWSIALASVVVALAVPQKPGLAFSSAFTANFLLWAGIIFIISTTNKDVFIHKLSTLILKTDNPVMLIAGTALVGGLVSGLAALTASLFRSLLKKNQSNIA